MRYFVQRGNTRLNLSSGNINNMQGIWGPGRLTIYDLNKYGPTFGGGHDFWTLWRGNTLRNNVWTFMDNNNRGPLDVNRLSQNTYTPRDLEVFSVTL